MINVNVKSGEQLLIVKLAFIFMESVLGAQLDKNGYPLTAHCYRVARRCEHLSLDQYLAAILHDTVEDGAMVMVPMDILECIELLFGETARSIVEALSRTTNQTYSEYIRRLAQTRVADLAIPVKLADLADNMDQSRGSFPGKEMLLNRYGKAVTYLQSVMDAKAALVAMKEGGSGQVKV